MTAPIDAARAAARVRGMGARLESAAAEAVRQSAEAALSAAQSRAPVRTGRLRDSLSARAEGTAASVSTSCGYAAAVELGTSRQPARPFLFPAAQAQRLALPALAAQLGRRAIEGN